MRTSKLSRSLSLLAVSASCLPTTDAVKNRDTVLTTYEVNGLRRAPVEQVRVESTATTLTLVLETVTVCEREQRQRVTRWRDHELTTRHPALHALAYAFGLGLGGLGGFVAGEYATSADPADLPINVTDNLHDGTYVGIGLATVGGLLLLSALGTSITSTDTEERVGNIEVPVAGTQHPSECERVPAPMRDLGLVLNTDGRARVYVPVGKTDSSGRIAVPWRTITEHLPANVKPEALVVMGARDAVDAELVRDADLPSLASVIVPLIEDAEGAWTTAIALDTPEAYQAFRNRFPGSPHTPEAEIRSRSAQARRLGRDFDAALASGNFDAASAALETLRVAAEPAVIAAAQARLDGARSAWRVQDLRMKLPELLAQIGRSEDPGPLVAAIRNAIEDVRVADPELSQRADTQLTSARADATARLVRDGQQAAGQRELALAVKRFASAATIAVDPAVVERARKLAFEAAVRTGQTAARQLAKQRKYEDAIAIIERLVPVAEHPNALEADRAAWTTALDRLTASDAERQARVLAQQQQRAERDAAAQAARERRAAEQVERDEAERQRSNAAHAADEQRKADAAARRASQNANDAARVEAARAATEQRRAEAEPKRAQQAAADATRAEVARKAAADEKLAEDERKRREATERLADQVAKAQRAAAPATVQLELPARYATDDALMRLPVPASCKATTTSFYAKPTTCKDCAPRSMSRVDMTCGSLSLTFKRDQNTIWLTCTSDHQSCEDCLDTGRRALATFVESKEQLLVVQGCPKAP